MQVLDVTDYYFNKARRRKLKAREQLQFRAMQKTEVGRSPEACTVSRQGELYAPQQGTAAANKKRFTC